MSSSIAVVATKPIGSGGDCEATSYGQQTHAPGVSRISEFSPHSDDNWAVALSNFGPVSPKQKAAIKNVLNSTLPLTVEL